MLGERLVRLLVGVLGLAEVVEDLGFAGPVAGVAAQVEGMLMVVGGLLITTLVAAHDAEVS